MCKKRHVPTYLFWLLSRTYTNIRQSTSGDTPQGLKVYWKKVGNPRRIGTSYKGIGPLIDDAVAAKAN